MTPRENAVPATPQGMDAKAWAEIDAYNLTAAEKAQAYADYFVARDAKMLADEQDRQSRELTHAEYAAKFPPRDGYKCTTDPKGDTYGGGCFNCGWKGSGR